MHLDEWRGRGLSRKIKPRDCGQVRPYSLRNRNRLQPRRGPAPFQCYGRRRGRHSPQRLLLGLECFRRTNNPWPIRQRSPYPRTDPFEFQATSSSKTVKDENLIWQAERRFRFAAAVNRKTSPSVMDRTREPDSSPFAKPGLFRLRSRSHREQATGTHKGKLATKGTEG